MAPSPISQAGHSSSYTLWSQSTSYLHPLLAPSRVRQHSASHPSCNMCLSWAWCLCTCPFLCLEFVPSSYLPSLPSALFLSFSVQPKSAGLEKLCWMRNETCFCYPQRWSQATMRTSPLCLVCLAGSYPSFKTQPLNKAFPKHRQKLCTSRPLCQSQFGAIRRTVRRHQKSDSACCYSKVNLSTHQLRRLELQPGKEPEPQSRKYKNMHITKESMTSCQVRG